VFVGLEPATEKEHGVIEIFVEIVFTLLVGLPYIKQCLANGLAISIGCDPAGDDEAFAPAVAAKVCPEGRIGTPVGPFNAARRGPALLVRAKGLRNHGSGDRRSEKVPPRQ